MHAENYSAYGARKVWLQLRREGIEVARYTVERLMGAVRRSCADGGGVIQAGWGLSGSMRHSAIQFYFRKPKGLVPALYAFTLTVIDSSFNSGWSSEFSLAVT